MQHTYFKRFSFLAALLLIGSYSQAQSLVSGFMVGKGHGSVSFTGTAEKYRNVYLVPEKVKDVPIFNEIRVSSVSVYANYGISNKVEAVVSLPYIRSEGKATDKVLQDLGYTNVRQGLQDLSVLFKFKTATVEVGSSVLDLLGVVGASTPASNYQSNTGLEYIIAIGNRATKLNTLGIAHLKTPSGVFLTGQAGYSVRTGLVPNAFIADAKVGYAGLKLYAEGWASFQQSASSGTDILLTGFDGNFTATRVNYTRIGASVFKPIAQGFGVVLGGSQYISGRNLGKSTGVSLGVSYNY
ncbi:hypothetical protein F0P96_02205 [Hymenobacter busanensis]|uniref:Uncharacterized protein n=1 Tax=Hymenobacter busanensis TaxID=2607656 RepID=A0A7L4ZUV0_9BACT|nr:hypothetical protein [Hymenobacter busanensis]KAA9339455.1 hypothetical protein F0P96_02205 [Hymenobacter busanensis]QHJ06787.1 hypothetical protein GUY19_05545 [Hymenobacter busanensis]